MERGFRHFAYFGFPVFEWSVRRQESFTAHVVAAGHQIHEGLPARRVSWSHQQASWEDEIEGVAQWVKKLPKPLGIMAGNDIRGIQMLDACRRAGVAVPEEVAVVGVDNEELVCLLAYPPLSSVIPDAFRVGYESAGLLDRMMKGETVTEMLRSIPPFSVATRQSSDVTAIANPCVANAMRFIREHACEGIGVDDVLEHLTVSRSVLQRLFRNELGQTILDAITAMRMQRVKQLLAETDLSLADIADRAGFSYVEYLSTSFRRQTGQSPTFGWRGSARHWHRYETMYLLLAGLATPLVLSVHTVVSFDFAVGIVPGWHTTIFPPYFVAGAIYSGFAMVLMLAIPIRKIYGLEDFITERHLQNSAKVMLATGLDRRLRIRH